MTTWMDVRVRLSRGSGDVQTGQPHPIIGTPCEVPLPRTITSIFVAAMIGPAGPQGTKKKRPGLSGGALVNVFAVSGPDQ